jgi:hypothetical protein
MPEWVKRVLRTLFQTSTAGVLVAFAVAFGWVNGEAQAAALFGVLTVVCTAGQNALEENVAHFPKMLKS